MLFSAPSLWTAIGKTAIHSQARDISPNLPSQAHHMLFHLVGMLEALGHFSGVSF